MSDMFQDHANKAKEFYIRYLMSQFSKDESDELKELKYDWGFKRKLSKRCAFTYEKLNIPIRSKACTKLKCVYEQDAIVALLKNEKDQNQKKYFTCVMCDAQIIQDDLFYDSELAKALKTNQVCYFVRSIPVTPAINPQPFYIVDKNLNPIKQTLPELDDKYYPLIENSSNQILLNILALNIYKQRMETLQWLATNEDIKQFPHMQEFGQRELENEKQKYIQK